MDIRQRVKNFSCRIKNFKKNNYIHKSVKVDKKTNIAEYVKIYKDTSVQGSKIEVGTYIGWNCKMNRCSIGKFCSIAPNTQIIYGRHPSVKFVSTHPAFYSNKKQAGFTFTKDNIFEENIYADKKNFLSVIIHNDVWIGNDVKIMEGITIGNGAIIAAGAIVTKDVEPFSIVGGIPAKLLKYRFKQEEIEFLQRFRWWEKEFEWIKLNKELFRDIDILIENIDVEESKERKEYE